MISLAKKHRSINALLSEVSDFRSDVNGFAFSALKYREKYTESVGSGKFNEKYLDKQREVRDRLIADERNKADQRRERALAVAQYRFDELKHMIYADFSELPRANLLETIRFRREIDSPFSEAEIRMLTESATNYAELGLINTLAEKQAREPNGSAAPVVSFLPAVPPALESELESLRDARALIETFVKSYAGETGGLAKPSDSATLPDTSQWLAVIDAIDRPDNAISRLIDRLEKDYGTTFEGRCHASGALTEDEKRRVDILLADSFNKPLTAVKFAQADDALRELLIRDDRYRSSILEAEAKEAREVNDKVARGKSN